MSGIHPTAIVLDGAVVPEGTVVGPYSIIGANVKLGKGNRIGPHVVIEGYTEIGDENTIFQFASVGAAPQDLKFKGEKSILKIGNKNIIREYVTLQPGTEGGGMLTEIGNGNLFMVNSHVGHDTFVGNGNVFANSVALAGHVRVGNFTILGGLVGIHQFVRLGDHCFLGAGSMVAKDIPPFCIAQGDRAGLVGVNKIGLERRGFAKDEVTAVRRVYKALFLTGGTLADRIERAQGVAEKSSAAAQLIEFVSSSQRGLTFPRNRQSETESE